jgi:hypothetical protein
LSEYLISLKSDKEVKEYVREVLGSSDAANKFADEFNKRKKVKGSATVSQPATTQKPPAPAATLAQAQAQSQGKKKKKMQKLPADMLGFTTTLSGEIETLDDD